jgi:hypothetical protein
MNTSLVLPSNNVEQTQVTRPTYAERRAQQLAEGAPSIATTGRYKCRVKIVFTECPGPSYVDDGMHLLTKSAASCFKLLEAAEAAAREYSADRGYGCEAFLCDKCSAKRSVWHVRGRKRPSTVQLADALKEPGELEKGMAC